jgi:hypothetical protein
MFRPTPTLFATAGVLTIAGAADAYVNTMYSAGFDPDAQFGAPFASLDIASTSWNFPLDQNEIDQGKKDSGFLAEILDPSGNPLVLDPGTSPNTTSLRTDVYRVSSPVTITDPSGDLDLLPNDLVFAYTIGLVGNNGNTLETLQEFKVKGVDDNPPFFSGDGAFTEDILLGRGFTLAGLSNPTAANRAPVAVDGDLEVDQLFGANLSSLEFNWTFSGQSEQIRNTEEITLLVFARGAIVVDGLASFAAVSGQAGQGTSMVANDAPILIPTVPGPGAASVFALAGLAACRRRR